MFPDSRSLFCRGSWALYTHLFAPERQEAFHLFSYANANNIVSHKLFKNKRRVFFLSSSISNISLLFFFCSICCDCFTLSVYPTSTLMARKCFLTCHRAIISLQLHHKHTNTVPDRNRDTKQSEKDRKKKGWALKRVLSEKRTACADEQLLVCCYNTLKYSDIIKIIIIKIKNVFH